MNPPPPTLPSRHEVYDVLRGLAVLGTFLTNVYVFAYAGVPPWEPDPNVPLKPLGLADTLEWFCLSASVVLANGKFLALLCILFGVGIHVQSRQGEGWRQRHLRRMLALAIVGAAHYVLVFEYDVLFTYALAGILVARVADRPRARRTAFEACLVLHAVILLAWCGTLVLLPDLRRAVLYGTAYDVAFAWAPWLEQVRGRLAGAPSFVFASALQLPLIVCLMLAGRSLADRGTFLPHIPAARTDRRFLLALGFLVALPATLLLSLDLGTTYWVVGSQLNRYAVAPFLALGYAAVVASAIDLGRGRWIRQRLADAGRLSLTCYVGQNILASILFAAWGLGWMEFAYWPAPVALVLVWTILLGGGRLWLTRFRAGPLEILLHALAGLRTHRAPATPAAA